MKLCTKNYLAAARYRAIKRDERIAAALKARDRERTPLPPPDQSFQPLNWTKTERQKLKAWRRGPTVIVSRVPATPTARGCFNVRAFADQYRP